MRPGRGSAGGVDAHGEPRAPAIGGALTGALPKPAPTAFADKHDAAPPPFAMFGGNAQHTGRLAGPAPKKMPTEVWHSPVGGVVAGSPTIGPDGTIYVTSHDGGLSAFGRDGQRRWRFAMGDRSWSTPAVAADGTIYVGSDDDHLYAVTADGKLKWKLRLGACDPKGFGPESSRCDVDGGPTIGPDGTIYVGSDDHALWAISPAGALRWKTVTGEAIRGGAALGADNTIYVGSLDGSIYAIAPDGKVRWKVAAADKIAATPGVASNGTVLVGAQDEHLYAIAPDGTLLWLLAIPGDVDTTPALARDGTLYVAGDDAQLHAFR